MSGKGMSAAEPNARLVQFEVEALTSRMMLIIPKGNDPEWKLLDDADDFLTTYNYYLEQKFQGTVKELERELHAMKVKAMRDEAALRANAEQLLIHQKREDACRCNEGKGEDEPPLNDKKRQRSPSM